VHCILAPKQDQASLTTPLPDALWPTRDPDLAAT